MTPVGTRWPHPIRPATWSQTRRMIPVSTPTGGVMGSLNDRILSLETILRARNAEIVVLNEINESLTRRCADLEAVVDSKDDDIIDLIDKVRSLDRELEGLRRDTWRPHR